MTVHTIIIAPDPRLKTKSKSVEAVDNDIRTLMDEMLETMHAARGIGLAAPQIGIHKRIIVVDAAHEDEKPSPFRMANPEIIGVSDDDEAREEGCLSLPEQYSEVTRPSSVRVRYLDYENEICEMDAHGILAVCIQHEIDHLDGVLFVDHVSALKRNMILRRLTKLKKQEVGAV
jgi:peptide deformylase